MPEFGHPYAGLSKTDKKVSKDEVARFFRFTTAAEFEAIHLYEQIADTLEATDKDEYKLAIKVLRDVADEEREHVGEFMKVLKEIKPTEFDLYKDGEEEVEEIKKKL